MDEQNIQPMPEEQPKPGVIKDPILALAFMFSGYTFTLVSAKSGDRFTFKLDEAPKRPTDAQDAPPVYFVKLMNGQDNENDFAYIGFIKGSTFVHGKQKAAAGADAPSVKGFNFALTAFQQKHMPTTLEFWHEGRCGRCGRKLTVPESVEAGFGPECVTKAQGFSLVTMPPIKIKTVFAAAQSQPVKMNGTQIAAALYAPAVPADIEAMIEWKKANDGEGFYMDGEMNEQEARAFWVKRFRTNPLTSDEMRAS